MKGTQEGFLSRQINPPAGDRFWPIGQNLVVPVTSLPGLPKRGSFRVQSPARTPRAFPRRCAGSGTGDKLRPKAAICLSLSKNPIGFFDKLRREPPGPRPTGHPVSDFPQHHLHRKQADRQQRRAEEHVSHVDLPPDLPVGEGGQQVEPPEAVVHRLVEQQRQGHVQPAL